MRDLATVYGIAFAIVIAMYVEEWCYRKRDTKHAAPLDVVVLSLTEFRRRHR